MQNEAPPEIRRSLCCRDDDMEFQNRKNIRLKDYDYSTPGYYFVTVCTKDKQKLLCDIVGTVLLDGPKVRLTEYGKIVDRRLLEMADFYEKIKIDKYVVMPNHIHLLLHIPGCEYTHSGSVVPTNSKVGRFVGTFKRLSNRECCLELWQSRSHDHIIRGERDYRKIWEYIDANPAK